MIAIVELARQTASAGDSVILSPGFPSFDMFNNFEDRGLQFKEVVNKL
jgi:UDP-N-acetylmuramoylalanine--D-glutamate ligase